MSQGTVPFPPFRHRLTLTPPSSKATARTTYTGPQSTTYCNTTLPFLDPQISLCGGQDDTESDSTIVLNLSTELRVSNAGNKNGWGAIGVGDWISFTQVSELGVLSKREKLIRVLGAWVELGNLLSYDSISIESAIQVCRRGDAQACPDKYLTICIEKALPNLMSVSHRFRSIKHRQQSKFERIQSAPYRLLRVFNTATTFYLSHNYIPGGFYRVGSAY